VELAGVLFHFIRVKHCWKAN